MGIHNLDHRVWKEGKYYVAQSLKEDVSSFGSTQREALANLNEALALYFEPNAKNFSPSSTRWYG